MDKSGTIDIVQRLAGSVFGFSVVGVLAAYLTNGSEIISDEYVLFGIGAALPAAICGYIYTPEYFSKNMSVWRAVTVGLITTFSSAILFCIIYVIISMESMHLNIFEYIGSIVGHLFFVVVIFGVPLALVGVLSSLIFYGLSRFCLKNIS